MKYKNMESLNGLRAVCAFIIAFTFHYFCSFNAKPLNNILFWGYEYGKFCVEIFFLISGMVMFINYSENINSGVLSFQAYIVKRLKRIYPLFLITTLATALLIYLSVYLAGAEIGFNTLYNLLLNILLLGCGWMEDGQTFNTPGWFVCVLFVCYALFYVVESRFKTKRMYLYFGMMIFGIFLIHKNPNLDIPLLYVENGRGYLSFFGGCLFGYLYQNYYKESCRKNILAVLTSALAVVLGLIYLFSVQIVGDFYVIIGIFISPAVVGICIFSKLCSQALNVKILSRGGGGISFSIFLWNCPINVLINLLNYVLDLHINFNSTAVYFSVIVVTCITAMLSHITIEKKWSGEKPN